MGPRLGGRGDQRRLRAAARAAAHAREAARAAGPRPSLRGRAAGRARRRSRGAGRSPRRCSRTRPLTARGCAPLAELLLERYGIVTRETVLAEGIPGGFSSLYRSCTNLETLGTARRGYFVEGLGGAQFAVPGGDRAAARPAGGRARRRARARRHRPGQPLRRLAARGRSARTTSTGRRPARAAGAYVVHARRRAGAVRRARRQGPARPAHPVDAHGEPAGWVREALEALADHVRPRPHQAAGARALRRRAGRSAPRRRAADRAGLPPVAAEADADGLSYSGRLRLRRPTLSA